MRAALSPTYTTLATVLKVEDGDSYDVRLDFGRFGRTRITAEVPIRLEHGNTPDDEDPVGRDAATAYVKQLLPVGTRIVVRTAKLEKYGRTLATVQLPDGRDLYTDLEAKGYARPYEGGSR